MASPQTIQSANAWSSATETAQQPFFTNNKTNPPQENTTDRKKIAIVGAGPVGCAFAYHLIRAGHNVTLVARGQRLAQLQRNGGILTKKSRTAKETTRTDVTISTALDSSQPWDLVLLTVLAHQIDEQLLKTLQSCPATTDIILMFNTFAPLSQYYDTLGRERCIIGFPAIMAFFHDSALVHTFVSFGQYTIVSSQRWRTIITAAGIPTVHEPDMQSWLRTHAAFVIVFLASIVPAIKHDRGITWAEAKRNLAVGREGFKLVEKLGDRITPRILWVLMCVMPTFVVASLLWIITRIPTFRNSASVENYEKELVGLMESMIEQAPSPSDVRLISELRAKYT